MTDRPVRWEVEGEIDPSAAAAIGAVIAMLLAEEAQPTPAPPSTSRRSAWVMAGDPRGVPAPMPFHPQDGHGWTEVAETEPSRR